MRTSLRRSKLLVELFIYIAEIGFYNVGGA